MEVCPPPRLATRTRDSPVVPIISRSGTKARMISTMACIALLDFPVWVASLRATVPPVCDESRCAPVGPWSVRLPSLVARMVRSLGRSHVWCPCGSGQPSLPSFCSVSSFSVHPMSRPVTVADRVATHRVARRQETVIAAHSATVGVPSSAKAARATAEARSSVTPVRWPNSSGLNRNHRDATSARSTTSSP